MSQISIECENKGKHLGTGHYHMCTRCESGLESGCADLKIKGQKFSEWISKCPVGDALYVFHQRSERANKLK
jgi:hypothetical protein